LSSLIVVLRQRFGALSGHPPRTSSLQAIDRADRILPAMARELVENKGIGESADSVWRALGQLRPSTSAQAEEAEDTAIERGEIDAPAMLPLSIELVPCAALLEIDSSSRRPRRRDTHASQLSPF